MNPNSGEHQPGFEMPAPVNEEVQSDIASEKSVISPENKPQVSVQASSQVASSIALPSDQIAGTITNAGSLTDDNTDTPSKTATDADRIESVWIDKTKQIVSQTKSDPYEQKIQMSKFKAEYIKQRYGKTIKADDTVAK